MLFRLWESPELDLLAPAESGAGVAVIGDPLRGGHVVVRRHALVREVLADPATYRPDNALDAVTPIEVAALRILTRHGFKLPPTLANNAGPAHPDIRAILAAALHPSRVEAQRPWLTGVVRRRVTGLAADLRTGSPVDLYARFTADLPLLALARLIELPADDASVIKEFSRAALELFWAPVDAERQLTLAALVGPYHAVLRDFAARAGGAVGELREYAHTHGLGPHVVVAALFFLLVAGQETTSQFLTLLLARLAGEPDVLNGLITGTVDPADVVEEGLRLEPPIVSWRRIAARNTTLGGVAVPAGASVLLWLAAAGRDADVVSAPRDLRPGQPGSRRHLAFGAGAHRCVGAQLSRMESSVVVAETAALLRDARVLQAPWSPPNLSFRLPTTLVIGRPDAAPRPLPPPRPLPIGHSGKAAHHGAPVTPETPNVRGKRRASNEP